MHRRLVVFLLVFLLNTEAILASCEILRFVKEGNIARQCCSLKKKPAERNVQRFMKQGYLLLQNGAGISVCQNVEADDADVSSKFLGTRELPYLGVHQIPHRIKKCPNYVVMDIKGDCVDPFKWFPRRSVK